MTWLRGSVELVTSVKMETTSTCQKIVEDINAQLRVSSFPATAVDCLLVTVEHVLSVISRVVLTHLLILGWCAVLNMSSVRSLYLDIPSSLSTWLRDPLLNQNGHLWPDTIDAIVSP